MSNKFTQPILILAGGYGNRLGALGETTPKFSLSIDGKPLLFRTLKHIERSFDKNVRVIISTRPELIPNLERVLNMSSLQNISVLENTAHRINVIEGFLKALKLENLSENFWLMLSDIFYVDNPFNNVFCESDVDLMVGSLADNIELKQGGIIEYLENDGYRVTRILKKYVSNIKKGMKWVGISFCGKGFYTSLENLLARKSSEDLSLESIFVNRLYLTRTYANKVGDFVNINEPKHLELSRLLAARKLSCFSNFDCRIGSM